MLSLLMTILGVLYIAYSTFQKEQEKVLASQTQNFEQIKTLQTDLTTLQQSVTTGGKTELFSALESKVSSLQGEVKELKTIIKNMQGGNKTTGISANGNQLSDVLGVTNSASEKPKQTESLSENSNNLMTDKFLDQKLNAYTQKFETKIDHKLEIIIQHLNQGKKIKNVPGLVNSKTRTAKNADMEISTPTVETVKTVETPIVSEPTLAITKQVSAPSSPKMPDAPIASASADVTWLLGQPRQNFILQLASLPTQKGAEKLISTKGLKDAKVLPQTRNKLTNYIVVTGSFSSKTDADKLAKKIK